MKLKNIFWAHQQFTGVKMYDMYDSVKAAIHPKKKINLHTQTYRETVRERERGGEEKTERKRERERD